MPTETGKNASGTNFAFELPNANGQQLMAASRPVVIASNQSAVPVSGPLTDVQLRAAAVPVSLASTTITGSVAVTGPLSDTQLRLTPVPISGTVTTGGLTDTQIRATALPVSLASTTITGSVAVTGPLTDTQIRATALPVSGTVAVTGVATETTLAALNAKVTAVNTGAVTIGAALPTGANVIGAVTQSGTWNIGAITTLPALVAGSAIVGKVGIDQTTDGTTNRVNIDASLKSGTATRTTVASVVATGTILAANANRKGATIFNSDANALLLDLSGGVAAATRCQQRLTQYQSYEVGSGYTGAITGIWEADGAGQADVVEFT